MGALLKWLIGWPWCAHKWTVLHSTSVYDGDGKGRPIGTMHILQCAKCGDLKRRSLSA